MVISLQNLKDDLFKLSNKDKALIYQRFFKTKPGEYGEGDKFIGVTVPEQRIISKKYKDLPLGYCASLLTSSIHEERMTAVFILIFKFEKATASVREEIIQTYLDNITGINNWDLVDLSTPKLLGPYLWDKDRQLLYEWARLDDLWKQRIAIMSTFYFIRQRDFKDAFSISDILLHHKHDLIHKAVGWMLREIGNRDKTSEDEFLQSRYKTMPRTMLRYAIEKYPEEERQKYLKGEI